MSQLPHSYKGLFDKAAGLFLHHICGSNMKGLCALLFAFSRQSRPITTVALIWKSGPVQRLVFFSSPHWACVAPGLTRLTGLEHLFAGHLSCL